MEKNLLFKLLLIHKITQLFQFIIIIVKLVASGEENHYYETEEFLYGKNDI